MREHIKRLIINAPPNGVQFRTMEAIKEASMDEVLHYGPDPMVPESPVEVWEPYRGVTLCGGAPNAEAAHHGVRYRNDEHGRVWRRVLHGTRRNTKLG